MSSIWNEVDLVYVGASRRLETIAGYFCIAPFIVGLLLFTIGPILFSAGISLTKWNMVTPAQWVGFENYATLFTQDPTFWHSLKVTAIYTVVSVPLGIIVGLAIALLMNQGIRGIPFWRTVYYMPTLISGVAASLLWVWLLNPYLGLVNNLLSHLGIAGPDWLGSTKWALPSLIAMSLWAASGSMIIYLAGLQGIPTQLYEAATIDGAGILQRFLWITLPMMSPVLFFQLVMGIIASFQVFTNAYVMTNGGPADATLFYVLYLYREAFQNFHMGYASAMAWVLFLIILALTLLVFKSSALWVYYESERGGER